MTPSVSFRLRAAEPADVPALLEMKRKLQVAENSEAALRANPDDWLRDGFGPEAKFAAYVADWAGVPVGMLTCSERYYTSWAGSTLYIQDLYVEAGARRQGIATALLARAAVHAIERKCPIVELTVRRDNPSRRLYEKAGFARVAGCASYVATLQAMSVLAGKLPAACTYSATAIEN